MIKCSECEYLKVYESYDLIWSTHYGCSNKICFSDKILMYSSNKALHGSDLYDHVYDRILDYKELNKDNDCKYFKKKEKKKPWWKLW